MCRLCHTVVDVEDRQGDGAEDCDTFPVGRLGPELFRARRVRALRHVPHRHGRAVAKEVGQQSYRCPLSVSKEFWFDSSVR